VSIIDRFIIDTLNDHFVVPVIISPKSDAYGLLIIDVRDAVSNPKSLVKSEMNRENQGFIPSPHVKKGQVYPICDLAEIGCLQPGIEVPVRNHKIWPWPYVPSFDNMDMDIDHPWEIHHM